MSVISRNEILLVTLTVMTKTNHLWIKKRLSLFMLNIFTFCDKDRLVSYKNLPAFKFEQSKFKKDFVVMNQKSKQKATSSLERIFMSY